MTTQPETGAPHDEALMTDARKIARNAVNEACGDPMPVTAYNNMCESVAKRIYALLETMNVLSRRVKEEDQRADAARQEVVELEQEMADLRLELSKTKAFAMGHSSRLEAEKQVLEISLKEHKLKADYEAERAIRWKAASAYMLTAAVTEMAIALMLWLNH